LRAISRLLRLAIPLAVLVAGCAHQRPSAPSSPPSSTPPDAGVSTGSAPSESVPGSADPSEQITAEELATIPDPVPGATEEPPPVDSSAPSGAASTPTAPPPVSTPQTSTPSSGTSGSASGTTSETWIWRVQIFASPDRAQAERTARDASSRLNESYLIDYESSLYKVRMGAFATEAEAEPLKRKAVIEGYTGAFRVRVVPR